MNSRVEIAPFPGGKRIALTTSWDDNTVEDRRVVATLNALGIKGTFNVNSGLLLRTGRPGPDTFAGRIDASEVASLYAGHEVAIHSVSHPFLERLDRAQITAELLHDRQALEDLVGYPVRGMALPFGTYDERVLDVVRSLGIAYCRPVRLEPSFPRELFDFGDPLHQLDSELATKWSALYDDRNRYGVFYVWGHAFEFPRVGWDALERIYRPLAGHADVWYCTNIELYDYQQARGRVVIAANRRTAYNPSAIPVTLRVGDRLVVAAAGQVTALEA